MVIKLSELINKKLNDILALPDFEYVKLNFSKISDLGANNLYFADSGYNFVFSSAELKLIFFKTANVSITNKKTQSIFVDKYLLILSRTSEQKHNRYTIELFEVKENNNYDLELIKTESNLNFNETISNATNNLKNNESMQDIEISIIVDMIRRYLELNLIKNIIHSSSFSNDSLIILDGQIQPYYDFEKQIILDIFAKTNNFVGVSKKTQFNKLLSQSGYYDLNMNSSALNNAYLSSVRSVIAKLHDLSKHNFRIDFNEKLNVLQLLKTLHNSIDNYFIGYPYGLILADNIAKVSEQEKRLINMIIYLNCSDKEHFFNLMNQTNAHDIIDTINNKNKKY